MPDYVYFKDNIMLQKRLIGLITILAIIISCMVPAAASAGETPKPKVLLIGDSISLGYTDDVIELLKDKAEVIRPTNEKGSRINCGSSSMGVQGIDKWLGKTKWDVIHFNAGLWDLCYRHPDSKAGGKRDKINGTITAELDEYEANLRKIITRLKKTGAKLIWASTTPVPEGEVGRFKGDEIKYNAVAAKVMADNGIAVNDLYTYMLPKAETYWRGPGDVHFTKDGSRFLAERVAAMIECAFGPKTIKLWPNGAPGAKGTEAKDTPTMMVYIPVNTTPNSIAVLVCPGGGYGNLAMDHEGDQIARWLNSFGVTGRCAELPASRKRLRLSRTSKRCSACDETYPRKCSDLGNRQIQSRSAGLLSGRPPCEHGYNAVR